MSKISTIDNESKVRIAKLTVPEFHCIWHVPNRRTTCQFRGTTDELVMHYTVKHMIKDLEERQKHMECLKGGEEH